MTLGAGFAVSGRRILRYYLLMSPPFLLDEQGPTHRVRTSPRKYSGGIGAGFETIP